MSLAAPPDAREDGSPWAGMSGAGLVCGELLVGVVIVDPARFGQDRLLAVPLTRLLAVPAFVDLLSAERGEPVVLEGVEAQGVLERAYDRLPPRRARQSSSFLLGARYGVVAFRPREELEQLRAWAVSGEDVDVGVLTGAGGVGKTRLARELCATLAGEGWVTGPLAPRPDPEQIARLARVDVGVLVVVDDYAEARRGDVVSLLEQLARPMSGQPRRLLLSARQLGDWWTELQNDCTDSEVRDLLASALTIELGAAEETVADRTDAYRDAVDAYAQHTGRALTDLVLPDLSDRLFETLLFIHMAALSALPGGEEAPSASLGSIRADLLASTLQREQRYWARFAKANVPPLLIDRHVQARAVAVATLAASTTTKTPAGEDQTATLLEVLSDDIGSDVALRRRVARWLHDLYPARASWIVPLEPDLLGEALVADMLNGAPWLARDLLADADEPSTLRALTVLTRASRHHDVCRVALGDALDQHLHRLAGSAIDVAQQLGDPIGVLLADALERHPDHVLARAILNQVPQYTVSLRETAAVAATQALYDVTEDTGERASLLVQQSNRLSELGRLEEALTAIDEAVSVYRVLAEARPDAFLPNVAGSLNNQSTMLSGLGRREEALAAINEAVSVYRVLAEARPDAFLPDLAMSLNNQSNRQSELGRHEEALAAINEAVSVYRVLAEARPDAFLPDVAGSLNNQSNRLSELGRREDALAAINEAVKIRRVLAEARPDALLPNLATSLNNQSNTLSGLGRHGAALAAIDEALQLVLPILERGHYFLPDAGLRLVQNYVTRCRKAEREPDAETVRRMRAVLAAAGVVAEDEQ